MENRFSADKKIEDLSVEDLSCVLKQVTDHSLPEREKYPLVQKLQADAQASSNNTSFSSLVQSTSVRNGNRSTAKLRSRLNVLSKDNEFQSSHHHHHQHHSHHLSSHSHCQYKQVNYAQSLQELSTNNCDDSHNLASISNMNSVATSCHPSGGVSNRKPNRANSFTMPFLSDNSDNINNTSKILDHHLTNGTDVSRAVLNNFQERFSDASAVEPLCVNNSNTAQAQSTFINNSASQSPDNSSLLNSDNCGDTKQSAKNLSSAQNYSSFVSDIGELSSLVNNVYTDMPNKYQGILADNKGLSKSNSQSLAVEEEDDDKPCFGEMKNLQNKAEYFEFCGSDVNIHANHNQDNQETNYRNSVYKMSSSKSDDYAFRNSAYLYNNNNSNSLNSTHNYSQSSCAITNTTNNKKLGKKKKDEEIKLAGSIKGNIGHLDVSFLEKFVNETSSGSVLVNGVDKKNKGKTQKQDNESTKRATKSNDKRNGDADKGAFVTNSTATTTTAINANKFPFTSVSNSSSLSGDDITLNKGSNEALFKPNTSPELSSSNGTKSKKSKPKRKQDKKVNTQKGGNTECSTGVDSGNKCKSSKCDIDKCQTNKSHSSSDDFDQSDVENEDEDPDTLAAFYCRTKKSNSLLATKTVTLVDDEPFYTVSDSEMNDREQGFITPKNKYLKKKKIQQRKPTTATNNSTLTHNSKEFSNKNFHSAGSLGSNSLGRGYESERECSQSNSANPNSFASQSLSTSMLAIDSKSSEYKATAHVDQDKDAHFISHQSDTDSMINAATKDVSDNVPKIPSYADIAKSHAKLSQLAETSIIIEEFPQLETQSQVEFVEIVADCAKPLTNDEDSGTVNRTSLHSTVDVDSLNTVVNHTNDTLPVNGELPTHCDINAQANMNPKTTKHSVECKQSPQTETFHCETDSTKANIVNSVIEEDSSPPVVFCDENAEVCQLMFGNESPIVNGTVPKESNLISGSKLVFGFFDDIQSEVSLLQDSNFSPFELTNDSSNDSGVNIMKNSDQESNSCQINLQQINELKISENENLENFYKNAVRVNDLEDHFRKIDTEDSKQCQHHNSTREGKNAFSSTASSPIFSSFDSSPISSSTAVSSSSIQSNPANNATQPAPFVSCVSQYNIQMIEPGDVNVVQYRSLVQFIHNMWIISDTMIGHDLQV